VQVPEDGSFFRNKLQFLFFTLFCFFYTFVADDWNSEKKKHCISEVHKDDQFLYCFSLILNFAKEEVWFPVIVLVSFFAR
jgi:hypothetical protein